VTRGRVLVIDADEWTYTVLGRELRAKGWSVDVCDDARAGFQTACRTIPDCIVCAMDLPDIDGLWVARRIRTEGGPVARVPFLFVGEAPDAETRVQALHVGADAFLARPVSNEEILAQVDALVGMARRYTSDADEPSVPSLAVAFRGDLGTFPLASILMMLELERRTGTLEVVSSAGTKATLNLSAGLFASSEVDAEARTPIEALRLVLSWRAGKFGFRTREVDSLPPPGGSVGALVLEAMRLDDEQKADDGAPPASFAFDLAPQSSRSRS
jgi:CheY-like chemotaxis protein